MLLRAPRVGLLGVMGGGAAKLQYLCVLLVLGVYRMGYRLLPHSFRFLSKVWRWAHCATPPPLARPSIGSPATAPRRALTHVTLTPPVSALVVPLCLLPVRGG